MTNDEPKKMSAEETEKIRLEAKKAKMDIEQETTEDSNSQSRKEDWAIL